MNKLALLAFGLALGGCGEDIGDPLNNKGEFVDQFYLNNEKGGFSTTCDFIREGKGFYSPEEYCADGILGSTIIEKPAFASQDSNAGSRVKAAISAVVRCVLKPLTKVNVTDVLPEGTEFNEVHIGGVAYGDIAGLTEGLPPNGSLDVKNESHTTRIFVAQVLRINSSTGNPPVVEIVHENVYPQLLAKIIVHEIGHALGLPHPSHDERLSFMTQGEIFVEDGKFLAREALILLANTNTPESPEALAALQEVISVRCLEEVQELRSLPFPY